MRSYFVFVIALFASVKYADAQAVLSPSAEPLAYAEELPVFPGSDAAFHRYLLEHIQYPAEARRRTVEGTVVVRFVVDKVGRIRDAEVVRGVGSGLDQEALRLVRLMPWWKPGRQNGQPVSVVRTLPIIFRLTHSQ